MSWIELDVDGRKTRVAVARAGNAVWVSWGGITKKLAPESSASAAPIGEERELRAPMTGRVVKVAATVGAKTRAGDALVVLEAMKMEYRVAAPRDGVVESLGCREGDRVDLGHVLVTLAP
jgi:acetyl/propionyl-CoA carboxylase alpha subunit